MTSIDDQITTPAFAKKMAQQNDLFRRSLMHQTNEPTIPQGRIVCTSGVSAKGPEFMAILLQKLITFNEGMDEQKFEVQHETLCDGWSNTWTVTDENGEEKPQHFDSREEAQAELDAFLSDIAKEIETGEREPDQGYSAYEFHIMPIGNKHEGFTQESDPNGWHDMGVMTVLGETVWFKIDYYNLTYDMGVEDPSDLTVTRRVLTLMFPSEY